MHPFSRTMGRCHGQIAGEHWVGSAPWRPPQLSNEALPCPSILRAIVRAVDLLHRYRMLLSSRLRIQASWKRTLIKSKGKLHANWGQTTANWGQTTVFLLPENRGLSPISHSQLVPCVFCNRSIDVLDGDPSPLLGVIQGDVVFQCVGPGDVVVVTILPAPDQSARLIFLSCDGFEFHLHKSIDKRCIPSHAPREGAMARLPQNVGLAWCCCLRLNSPKRRSLARQSSKPLFGQLPCCIGIECNCRRGYEFRRHGSTLS